MRFLCNKIYLNTGKLKYVQASIFMCQKRNRFNEDNYEYIQKSRVPTLHFQASLPRLPIPELEKTCDRYLAAQRPLLLQEDFLKTQAIVNEFRKGEGLLLQKQLKAWDKRNKHTNYVSELWFDKYLRDRVPLPINYNPQLVFVNDKKVGYGSQLVRATNMLISSLRFMKSMRAGILDPEVFHLKPKTSDTELFYVVTSLLPSSVSWYGAFLFKAYPLDMSQYGHLFNTTRLPKIGKDVLFQDEAAKHMVVMRRGNFYVFDVLDRDGNILPPTDILACMKFIMDDTSPQSEFPIGILTTENRDIWAKARDHLESIGNKENLTLIDSGIFMLCLDDAEITDNLHFLLHHFLHSDGRNRWFDKSFSLLITKDGYAAVNFEHSWGDGVAVLRYFQDILKDSLEKPWIHPDTKPSNYDPKSKVRRLDFNVDAKVEEYIAEGTMKFDAFSRSLDIDYIEIMEFGRKDCKKFKVSPDCIMQLAFQVAFYKQVGKFVASYESCSTAAFKHGRTETMRPCTMATKEFCEALNSSNRPTDSELAAMIRKCSEIHGNLAKEAALGQGFDRHLYGLKLFAEKNGCRLPDIFQDSAYAAINHNIISTSTLSSPAVRAGGFGPVVKDGFGIAYTIWDKSLGAVVASYPPARDCRGYVQCLRSAFDDIFGILQKTEL